MSDTYTDGTECDECGALLDYPGNLWGHERVCDGCFDRLESMRR